MAVFKCKMCGGAMNVNGQVHGTCPYCGTTQTFPKLDDEKRAQLYERANTLRRENEFDKATAIYEMILSEDSKDAEAYWSLVLCKYGVEYVEDPTTKKRIPTINRTQYTSIWDDNNFKLANQYADDIQKKIYESEATVIDNIQKGILEVSSREEPFDIFICYKESDDLTGNRTQDSVYAYDLYDALTKEGFRVFFSRITLENKLGTAYEPYIFAALNSAKVMIVVGTSKDNFNAVWVKNEWARFISLMKTDKSKTLIPVYKDIDPTDLPDDFAYLQAQDMNKIGYTQDIVHGVSKLLKNDEPKVQETVVINNSNSNIEPLLERVFMFLEDGEWDNADTYCEKILDLNPRCAEAYLGKFMSGMKVEKKADIVNLDVSLDNNTFYQKAIRFGDNNLKEELENYSDIIKRRREWEHKENTYINACYKKSRAQSETDFLEVANLFDEIKDYKRASTFAEECRQKAKQAREESIKKQEEKRLKKEQERIEAKRLAEQKRIERENRLKNDSLEAKRIAEERIKLEKEEESKRIEKIKSTRKHIKIIVLIILLLTVALIVVFTIGNSKKNTDIYEGIENDYIYYYDQSLFLSHKYQYVWDFANILNDNEEQNLSTKAKDCYENNGFNIYYVTSNNAFDFDTLSLVEFIYNSYIVSSDSASMDNSILISIDLDNRELYIYTSGTCVNKLTTNEIDIVLDNTYLYATDEQYFDFFNITLENCLSYMD